MKKINKKPLRTHPAEKLSLHPRQKGDGKYEVGVINLFGSFRLENLFEPQGEHSTESVCKAWIAHMQKAHEEFCATLVGER